MYYVEQMALIPVFCTVATHTPTVKKHIEYLQGELFGF
jgi:hypothetical protein